MKRIFTLLGLVASLGAAQAQTPGTSLWAGEVQVLGYTTVGGAVDFSFAPLVDLAPGTQLRLTDAGWQAAGGLRPGETSITYTAPAGVTKGKVITYSVNRANFSGPLPLDPAGDQLFIYQGTDAAPTFVTALTYGPGGFGADATSGATTALPPGLTLGQSALALPTQPTGYYSGPARAGLPADLRAAPSSPANWTSLATRYTGWNKNTLTVSEGLVPDAQELAALRDLYNGTIGAGWINKTNWLQGTNNAEHWATWYGLAASGGDVTSLNLGGNNLQGTLPASLGNLRQLTYLAFPNNAGITGTLPSSIGNLTQLTFLRLSGCAIVAPLPSTLARLSQLQNLFLSGTQITGPIPAFLGSLTNLRFLTLNYSRFSGTIPPELGQLTNLTRLEICNGTAADTLTKLNLRGGLPSTFQNLTQLQMLNVCQVNLGGTVPAWLSQLRQLQRVYLDGNRLTGAVPPEVAALPNLQVLTLYRNRLSGLPPRAAFANPAALGLALQDNRLEFGALEPLFASAGQLGFNPTTVGDGTGSGYLPQTLPTDTVRQPLSAGQALTLASGIGGAHTRYQWQRLLPGSQTWQDIVGDSAASHIIQSAAYADAGTYRCRTVNSWVPGLTLYSRPTQLKWSCPALRVSVSPVGGTAVELGNSTTLKAVATPAAPPGGQPAPTYSWTPAAGLSATTGALVGTTPRQTTTYTCTVRDACGQTATAQVTVRVNPVPALVNPPVEGVAPPALVNAPPPAAGPAPTDMNFVRTYAPRQALTDTAAVRQGSKAQVQVKTEYLDGLGRPVQTVLRQETPAGRDLVQPVAYDALGRSPRQYQPFADPNPSGNPGAYRPQALSQQYGFYRQDPATTLLGPGNANDNVAPTGVAYAETVFEPSPLNRVLQQAAPGEAWSLAGGHAQQRLERPSLLLDSIPRYQPSYGATAALASPLAYQGLYGDGELWLVQTQDEHGYRQQEYKDKLGQVVAKRTECPRPARNGGAGGPGQAGVAGVWLSTYYVYDDFQRLRCVLPPKAATTLPKASPAYAVAAALEPLLFRYRYDGRGRVIAKVVPGQGGETQLVYDYLDRPVLSQDANQRAKNQWSFTKYDALGRVILTGLVSRNVARDAAQAEADAQAQAGTLPLWEAPVAVSPAAPQGYSLGQAYPRLGTGPVSAGYFAPLAAAQVLTVAYFDDYDFTHDGQPDAQYDAQLDAALTAVVGGVAPVADGRTQGLATRTLTRVLGVPAAQPGAWLTTTTFYDDRARPIQVQGTNARGGYELVTTQLDFSGKVVQSVSRHEGPNHTPVLVRESMRYDHAERLTQTTQQLLGVEARPVLIDSLRYNELGQVVQRQIGTGALLQTLKYSYNPRGWLTKLNDPDQPSPLDLFNLRLCYEQGFTVSQYNGNITGQRWRGRDGVERAYGYLYDGASRLLQGDYVARIGVGPASGWQDEQQRYALRRVRYDENGNILGLQRRGLLAAPTRRLAPTYGWVDKLAYSYPAGSNQLRGVNDSITTNQLPRPAGYNGAPTSLAGDFQQLPSARGTNVQDYAYDPNGNLTLDKNKNITSISYNHLNLPRRIAFGTGADSVVFRYSASGQKVAKLVYQTGKPAQRTDYLGPYQYEQDSLRFFPHAEGRVLRLASTDQGGNATIRWTREYTVKDHLGNLRLAYRPGQPRTLLATLEADPATRRRETQLFDSASVSPPVAQPVGAALARTGTWAARLNAGGPTPQPLGPLAQLSVQRGDTVVLTAPGHYEQAVPQSNFVFSFLSWLGTLFQPRPTVPVPVVDGRPRPNLPLLQVGVAAGLSQLPQLGGGVPKGYARVLVFGKDSSLVDQRVVQLSSAALTGYEPLRVQVVAPQDGYITAYVGNESPVDVLFDDVSVEHRPGLQVQENSYDPWGLSLSGLDYQTPGLRGLNQYQFNGKERQLDLGLGWSDYGARFYDQQAPHWNGVDPLADKMRRWSPYAFSFDNPLRFQDPDGMAPDGPQQDPPGKKLPVVNGVAQAALSEVTVTGTSPGPAWARSVIRNYQSGQFFTTNHTVAANAYCWTPKEMDTVVKYEFMALTVGAGGAAGLADIAAGSLFEGGAIGIASRVVADAGVQTAAGKLQGQSWSESAANVNWLESGMAGIGFNPFTIASTTAAFNLNFDKGFDTSFTPGSSLTAFGLKTAIGTGFGIAGAKLGAPRVTATIGLSTALRTGSGALGVQVGRAATHTMEKGVGVAEEYFEGQSDKTFPASQK